MNIDYTFIEGNLDFVLNEIKGQPAVAVLFPPDCMSYEDQIYQLSEWLQDSGEYGLVYENIISILENFPFKLSGKAAVKLLEVGLIFGFKTESEMDRSFDRR